MRREVANFAKAESCAKGIPSGQTSLKLGIEGESFCYLLSAGDSSYTVAEERFTAPPLEKILTKV